MPILGSILKRAYALRNMPFEIKSNSISHKKAQTKQLEKLIRKSQFTAFGEHYAFSKLLESDNIIEDFKRKRSHP